MPLSIAPAATIPTRCTAAAAGVGVGVGAGEHCELAPAADVCAGSRLAPRVAAVAGTTVRAVAVAGSALAPLGTGRSGGRLRAVLLPFVDWPAEVSELLFSAHSAACTAQTAQRMAGLFAAPAAARAGATGRDTLDAVLRAPRGALPDALWIAAMHALLFPRSAEIWAKFAAAVGADTLDADEWRPALPLLAAAFGADAGGAHSGTNAGQLQRTGAELGRVLLAGEHDKLPNWSAMAEAAPAPAPGQGSGPGPGPGSRPGPGSGSGRGARAAARSASAPPPAQGAGRASGSPRAPRGGRRDGRHGPPPVSLSLDTGLACVAEDAEEAD